jgi:hypothetical protein
VADLAGRWIGWCRVWRLNVDVSLSWNILDGLQRHGRRLKLRSWFLHSWISRWRWDRILEDLQWLRLTRRRHLVSVAGLKNEYEINDKQ